MERETTIGKKLQAMDDKVRYDAACKRLLSEKIILAWIMKSCLEEYRDYEVKEIARRYIEGEPQVGTVPVGPDESAGGTEISGLSTEDATMTEGTVTYDIRFAALAPVSGELIRLIINVEAQNDFYPGYPLIKRGIYYCSRMISAQYGTEFTEAHYDGIKKVYSIWICMNPPKSRRNTITRYYIAEDNLVGEVKETKSHYDLMAAVMICLGEPGDENYSGILRLLDVLFSVETNPKEKGQILENDFSIKMTQSIESEVSLMCNLSKGIEERGIEKGIERGRQEGIKKGRQEGIEKGRQEERQRGIQAMVSALKDLNIAEDVILKKLQEKFGLSAGQARKYIS